MSQPVTVVEYDPNWVVVFSRLRDMLAQSLGTLPVAIEHVGSTSVPGAVAKPIIDIDVVLGSANDLRRTIDALAGVGYRHLGDLGIRGREAFESPASLPGHHLYVVVLGNPEYLRHLEFRDYLRSHPEMTSRYSELKKSLATKFRSDRDGYTEAKTAFVEAVLRRAEEGRD